MPPPPRDPPTPAEWHVLKAVFQRGACGAREVIEDTGRDQGWSASTVKTLLGRLVEKGHLRTRRVGNSFLYRASRTIHTALRERADRLLEQVVPGSLGPLIQYLVGKGRLSNAELDELQAFLAEQRAAEERER